MKVKKNGTVKLESGEIRVGNFFVKREDAHFKVTDLNGVFSFRAASRMPIGVWMDNIFSLAKKGDDGALNTLNVYVATMWSLFSVAPDDGFVRDVLTASDAALNRHPDWYGIKADATDEDDAEAIREVREMKEFEGEAGDLKVDGDGGED